MARWRGLKALVHDAVDATTELVREGQDSTHRNIRRVTDRLGPVAGPARLVDGIVRLSNTTTLASIRAVNLVVEVLTDLALDATTDETIDDGPPIPLRSDVMGTAAWVADASLATVNAAVGNHLAATHNGLDLRLALRVGDRYLRPEEAVDPTPLVVVFVHGLGTTEWGWAMLAESYHGDPATAFGTLLARDCGASSVYVRYNTGRAVGENGRELAAALERALGGQVGRIVLVGHSMGGLVARAACETARKEGLRWLGRVDLVVSLGSPHQGAPLAHLGQLTADGLGAVDLPATRVLARILAARSAGIRDLAHGDVADLGRDPDATAAPADRAVPLLEGITYAFFSATLTTDPDHPAGWLLGDLLVRRGSASGPADSEGFPIQTGNLPGVLHHQLQNHPAVYERLKPLVCGS